MSETLWWAYPPLFTVCYVLLISLVIYTKAWRSENLTHTKKWGCANDIQIRIVADIPLILSCPGFINPRALKASQVALLLMWLWNVNFDSIWYNFKIIFPKKNIFYYLFYVFYIFELHRSIFISCSEAELYYLEYFDLTISNFEQYCLVSYKYKYYRYLFKV